MKKSRYEPPQHGYCHGYPESQFVAKYLNTSSIKINPHPLSAAGPARPFPSVLRTIPVSGGASGRGESDRAWEERGTEAKEMGVAQYQLSRSLTLDKIRRDTCALSENFSPWFQLSSPPPSPTSIRWTFPGLQRTGLKLAESGGRRLRLTSLWTRGCGQGPMSRPGWRLSALSTASLCPLLTGL